MPRTTEESESLMPRATEAQKAWNRMVLSKLTMTKLRGLFAGLGEYLKHVKSRMRDASRVPGEWLVIGNENAWERMVQSQLTLTKVRGFFASLGEYLKHVNSRRL